MAGDSAVTRREAGLFHSLDTASVCRVPAGLPTAMKPGQQPSCMITKRKGTVLALLGLLLCLGLLLAQTAIPRLSLPLPDVNQAVVRAASRARDVVAQLVGINATGGSAAVEGQGCRMAAGVTNASYLSQCRHVSILPQFRPPPKLVVFFNPLTGFFGRSYDFVLPKCKVNTCHFTLDRALLPRAHAVVVHVCRLNDPSPPAVRPAGQVWVAYAHESPEHFAGHHRAASWRSVFNWTMTYRLDSDIFAPYSFLKLRPQPPGKDYAALARAKHKPVAWFVTNCHTYSRREVYVRRLQEHIQVDVFGCGPYNCSRQEEQRCMQLLNTTYFFYLSFENSLCKDYVSEKFFKTFNDINVVPIVRGGADYGKYFDRRTFINTADFDSPKQLANHLHKLISDTKAYAEMLEAKDVYAQDIHSKTNENAFCELCERLHDEKLKERKYPDFMNWMERDICRKPTDL